jgi:hypothetical protein
MIIMGGWMWVSINPGSITEPSGIVPGTRLPGFDRRPRQLLRPVVDCHQRYKYGHQNTADIVLTPRRILLALILKLKFSQKIPIIYTVTGLQTRT